MPNFFYYDQTNQKQGPVDEQHLRELAAQGIIGPSTPLETETGHHGTAGQIPGLFPSTPLAPSPFAGNASPFSAGGAVSPQAKSLDTYFMILWISAIAIAACGIGIIPYVVFFYILLYQLWKQIPANVARTSPGKAVGFCFIPFFNLYWIFVSWKGLGEDLNKALQQRGIQYRVNENLGLVGCILTICGVIPYVGVLVSIAAIVMLILYLKSCKDGAIALLEQQGA